MIHCYMGADRVAAFGHQYIKALIKPPPEGPDAPAAIAELTLARCRNAPQRSRL
jgi:hypothetical protein